MYGDQSWPNNKASKRGPPPQVCLTRPVFTSFSLKVAWPGKSLIVQTILNNHRKNWTHPCKVDVGLWGWGDGVVGVNNGDDVEAEQLTYSGPKVVTAVLVVEVRLRHQNLQRRKVVKV